MEIPGAGGFRSPAKASEGCREAAFRRSLCILREAAILFVIEDFRNVTC